MKTIRVKKTQLLHTLTRNRTKHEREHALAMSAFFKKQTQVCTAALAVARKGKQVTKQHLPMQRPTSYVQHYDDALAMLRVSVDDVIELDQREFRQLVQDDWDWRQEFVSLSNSYGTKLK